MTSSRVGGVKRPCVFGCPLGPNTFDTLQHYLLCGRLWRPIVDEVALSTGTAWEISVWSSLALSVSPALELEDNERTNLISALTVAVDVYNVVNRGERHNLSNTVKESVRGFFISKAGYEPLAFKLLNKPKNLP